MDIHTPLPSANMASNQDVNRPVTRAHARTQSEHPPPAGHHDPAETHPTAREHTEAEQFKEDNPFDLSTDPTTQDLGTLHSVARLTPPSIHSPIETIPGAAVQQPSSGVMLPIEQVFAMQQQHNADLKQLLLAVSQHIPANGSTPTSQRDKFPDRPSRNTLLAKQETIAEANPGSRVSPIRRPARPQEPRYRYENESSDESSDESIPGDSHDRHPSHGVSITTRRKGPKEPGLKEVRCTEDEFRHLVSYRTYRLPHQPADNRRAEHSRVKKNTTYLAQALGTLMFSGIEPLSILDFLAQYTLQCLDLGLSENEAYISLRSFLRPPALDLFNAAKASVRDANGIYNWPSSVNFLLRAYATDGNIEQGVQELNKLSQNEDETEEAYSLRLQRQHSQCGNYLSSSKLTQRFISGLLNPIRPAIQRYRQYNRRSAFLQVVEEAKTEGRIYRARTDSFSRTPSGPRSTPIGPTIAINAVADSMISDGDTSMPAPPSPLQYSVTDPSLLAVTTMNKPPRQGNNMRWNGPRRNTARPGFTPPLPRGNMGPLGPGWVNPPTQPQQAVPAPIATATAPNPTFCTSCFTPNHTAAQCRVDIFKNAERVKRNYENMPLAAKALIPPQSYWILMGWLPLPQTTAAQRNTNSPAAAYTVEMSAVSLLQPEHEHQFSKNE